MTNLLATNEYRFLQLVHFRNWINWDVKSYAINTLQSEYTFVKLSEVLQEQTQKVKLKDFPDTEFGILGVNNKIGIFDAYLEKGAKINQPYKKMQTNWIAYNPYRVNVGSIGIKTENEHYEYISNAYVVFSCDESKLDTEFFFRLFKTATFNNLVKKSTKGSVRQNLSFELLSNISIPLPPLHIQKALVKAYDAKLAEAEALNNEAETTNKQIKSYLMQELGITIEEKQKKKGLQMIRFKDLDRWGVDFAIFTSILNKLYKNTTFPIERLGSRIEYLQYGLSEKANRDASGVPMIRMNNIQDSDINYQDLKYIEKCSESYLLQKGDLLFNRTNSKELVGKTAIFNNNVSATFASYLIRVRFEEKTTDVRYINFLMNSIIGRVQINTISRQVLGQANINSRELQDFTFPFPPLEIQNKIADQIDAWKKEIKTKKEQAEAIKQQAKEVFEKSLFETK